jgi:hypothetical protein
MYMKMEEANEMLRRGQRLSAAGIIDTLSRARELLRTLQQEVSTEYAADASILAAYFARFTMKPVKRSNASRGVEVFLKLAEDAPLALVELNPGRSAQGDASMPLCYEGPALIGHIAGRSNNKPSAVSYGSVEVGELTTWSRDAAVQFATGCSQAHGLRVVSAALNAAPSGVIFDIHRDGTGRVDVDFTVRVTASVAAQAINCNTFHDSDESTPVYTGEGTWIGYSLSTEAEMLSYLKTLTVGSELSKSVRATTENGYVIGLATFSVSTIASTISLGGSAHAGVSATTALFHEIEPVRLTYRGEGSTAVYDSSGVSAKGRQIDELVGIVSYESLRSLGVSDRAEAFLRLIQMANELHLEEAGNGGSESAFSNVMDQIYETKYGIAAGTIDANYYFSLPRIFSNDSGALTAAQAKGAYNLWYKQLSSYLSVLLTDVSMAEAFGHENLADVYIY